jgi:hypothetical protein
MRWYVGITGVLSGLITIVHIWEIWHTAAEIPRIGAPVWFLALTLLSAGLCCWAVILLLRRRER